MSMKASYGIQAKHRRLSLKRQYNKALILNCIRKYSPISRTKIRALTGIRLASITDLAQVLWQEGYLLKAGVTESRRGRKQALLRLNARNGFAVGLEYDADHVCAVVVDLEANLLARSRMRFHDAPRRAAMIRHIIQTAKDAMERSGCPREKGVGIGVADPGLIDSRRGISVFSSTMKDWRNVPLKKILEKALRLPVFMEENIRAKALCEKMFGDGREVDNLMFIGVGAGIGCGVMIRGELYRGAMESAGELGHTRVMDQGPLCTCGRRGCLEVVASLPALARQAALAVKRGGPSRMVELAGGRGRPITAEHVFKAANQGDKTALSVVRTAAGYLGIGIANAVNLFNPDMIIFDSSLAHAEEVMVAPVIRSIQQQALDRSTRHLKFKVSRMGEEGGALAASTLALDKVFEIPQLPIPEYL